MKHFLMIFRGISMKQRKSIFLEGEDPTLTISHQNLQVQFDRKEIYSKDMD